MCSPSLNTYDTTTKLRLGEHLRRGGGEIVKARGQGGGLGKGHFWTWLLQTITVDSRAEFLVHLDYSRPRP